MNSNLKPISLKERTLLPNSFFFLWAGAGISLAEVMAGGFLAPVGFLAGLLAIIVGHLVGNTLFSLGGVIGSEQGIPAMVAVRPAFGIRGSYLAAALNIIQLIGWTAIMLIVAGEATTSLLSELAGFSNYPVIVVALGVITTIWAYTGSRTWRWLQSSMAVLLLGFSLYVTYVIIRDTGVPEASWPANLSAGSIMLAIDLVIAMPLSWMPLAADYSRFGTTTRGTFWGTWLGYFLTSSWMYFLGLLAALTVGTPDIIQVLTGLGLGASALVIVILSTFTTAFLDVYSTAVSALNLIPKSKERPLVLVFGLLSTLLALVFPIGGYESFLLFIGSVFIPLFGVVLADYFFIRKRRYSVQHLFTRGLYWYRGGINPAAVIAWLVGLLTYYLAAKTALGSSLPSLLVSACLYLVGMSITTTSKKGVAANG